MNRGLAIVFGVIGILLVAIVLYNSIQAKNITQDRQTEEISPVPTNSIMEENQNLKIEDIKEGEGEPVKEGDTVEVNYTGTLTNEIKFDSSYDHGQTFKFAVGSGEVIEGWDKGLIGMKKSGVRKLTIPPTLGYGEQGAGNVIPPNSTLIFQIELVSINP